MPTLEERQTENEIVTESHVVERDRTHLNDAENALLRELLRPGAAIEAVIPADAAPEQLWRTLDACVRGLGLLEARSLRLKFIVGKLLLVFENRPSLYKELGYETYSDFMNKGAYEKLGLHRTSAYEGRMAATWPQLTPDRYAGKLGPKKMNILNKFMGGGNSNAEEWLQAAESMKVGELKQYVEERSLIGRGETVGVTITIQTNLNVFQHWKSFCNDGRIHQVVGSKDHGQILKAMIEEVFDEWIGKYDRDRKAKMEAQT